MHYVHHITTCISMTNTSGECLCSAMVSSSSAYWKKHNTSHTQAFCASRSIFGFFDILFGASTTISQCPNPNRSARNYFFTAMRCDDTCVDWPLIGWGASNYIAQRCGILSRHIAYTFMVDTYVRITTIEPIMACIRVWYKRCKRSK